MYSNTWHDERGSVDDAFALLQEARTLNSQLVSLPRLQLLKILALYGPDGIEFRELQASLAMSDGKLLSNLYALRDLGVAHEEKSRVENRMVTTYRMTEGGRDQWERTRSWLRRWLEET